MTLVFHSILHVALLGVKTGDTNGSVTATSMIATAVVTAMATAKDILGVAQRSEREFWGFNSPHPD